MVPLWVSELAAAFWERVGATEPFPRTLREPIARSGFQLAIKELPGLSVRGVERYLARVDFPWQWVGPERPLRACLAAFGGNGFVFIDPRDAADERVFSLAHELAHFLRDYWQPRARAVVALGEAVLDVHDGHRLPRPGERLHGLLRNVVVGAYAHLMERDEGRLPPEVAAAERAADRLAYELLAPAAEVVARLPPAGAVAAAALLRLEFGLPSAAAETYAALLFPPGPPPDPLLERLRKALAARRTSAAARERPPGGACDE